MPLGATGSLFVLQNLENEKPQNTLILSNNNSLIESISLNDEEFKTTSFNDEKVLENFVSKFFDVVDTHLTDLKDFILNGRAMRAPTLCLQINPNLSVKLSQDKSSKLIYLPGKHH